MMLNLFYCCFLNLCTFSHTRSIFAVPCFFVIGVTFYQTTLKKRSNDSVDDDDDDGDEE